VENPKVVPIEVDICSQRPKTEAELQQDREEEAKLHHPYEKIFDQLRQAEEAFQKQKENH
jgi:hypothetical protein